MKQEIIRPAAVGFLFLRHDKSWMDASRLGTFAQQPETDSIFSIIHGEGSVPGVLRTPDLKKMVAPRAADGLLLLDQNET
jgi:hypothetical protein